MPISDMTLATIIFVATYAVIVTEKIDRTKVAIAGALIMVLSGVIDQEVAVESIDFNTLGLLIGMMILVAIVRRTGVFDHIGFQVAKWTGGRIIPMMAMMAVVTAVASAFLDNVTTILLVVPVTIALADLLGIPAKPFLITQILASNIGGAATLIGDPPNILIGSATGLTFLDFLINLGPIIALNLALVIAIWALRFRSMPEPSPERRAEVIASAETERINDYPLLRKCLVVLGLTMVGFLLHGALHLEAATVALAGAAALLLVSKMDIHHIVNEVEWPTIFFFGGLFVLVGGIEHVGLLEEIAAEVVDITGGDVTLTVIALLWLAAILSMIVDNIPAVTTLIPLSVAVGRGLFPELSDMPVEEFVLTPEMLPVWWSLALGADLGGNGTLVGASANVVGAGLSERHGERITFMEFTRQGMPITLLTLVVSTVYVYLVFLL
ncbi:MAG: ArsB/NhaD family transporter [Thermomicrobiales bacterium]